VVTDLEKILHHKIIKGTVSIVTYDKNAAIPTIRINATNCTYLLLLIRAHAEESANNESMKTSMCMKDSSFHSINYIIVEENGKLPLCLVFSI
jgi:hypothetical protein